MDIIKWFFNSPCPHPINDFLIAHSAQPSLIKILREYEQDLCVRELVHKLQIHSSTACLYPIRGYPDDAGSFFPKRPDHRKLQSHPTSVVSTPLRSSSEYLHHLLLSEQQAFPLPNLFYISNPYPCFLRSSAAISVISRISEKRYCDGETLPMDNVMKACCSSTPSNVSKTKP